MAFPTSVNDQITDSVTQANVKVLGDSPAMALGNLYQATAQALAANTDRRVALLAELAQLSTDPDQLPEWRPLLSALTALLQGDPGAARATLPDLDPMNAVELERLIAGTWP